MKTTILVKTGNERGWRVPTVTAYRNEDELRMLLKDSPELLPGDDASRPVVLAHEFPVTFGSVDLVGVSPTGALTVVECKLRANSEIRRTIVGQLFAYAAAMWEMTYEEFDEAWQIRTKQPPPGGDNQPACGRL
jgi:RecB family endonuclease NucS